MHERERGAVLELETTWQLARAWYHDRLDPGWRRQSASATSAVFRGLGLTSPFWALDGA